MNRLGKDVQLEQFTPQGLKVSLKYSTSMWNIVDIQEGFPNSDGELVVNIISYLSPDN